MTKKNVCKEIDIDMRLLPIYDSLTKEIIRILRELKTQNISDKQFCKARDIIIKPHVELAKSIILFQRYVTKINEEKKNGNKKK